MNKTQRTKIQLSIQALPPKLLWACIKKCDGHTIMRPEAFVGAGMPEQLTEYFVNKYQSDTSDPKNTITGMDGEVLKSLKGIYGLDALRRFATLLGVEYEGAYGRGTQARYIKAALAKFLGVEYKE